MGASIVHSAQPDSLFVITRLHDQTQKALTIDMSRQIIAIDIRNSIIAAVALDMGLKTNTVTAFNHLAFNGEGTGEEELSAAISEVLLDLPHDNASFVITLPTHNSIFRTLSVPFKDDSKIKQVLPFELEPSLPLPVEDLVIGFQKNVAAEQSQVLAAAMERRYLDHYMAPFANHNLQLQLVAPGSFPSVLSLIADEENLPEQAIVVDVDTDRVALFALSQGRICLVRSLPASIASEEATESLALKIRQTLTAFGDAQVAGFTPSVAFLNGPCLDDPAAVQRLSEALDVPTRDMPFKYQDHKVEINENLNYSSWIYDNALAAAFLEVDGRDCPSFHRSRSTIRNFWASYRPYVKTPAILLAFVLMLGLGAVIYDSHLLQKRLDGIQAQMEEVFKSAFPGFALTKAPILSQMQSKLKETQKNVAAPVQSGNRMRSIDALLEISRLLPDSIALVINRMVVSEETITLSGETGGFNTVDDIKGRIEKSPFFKKVTIASANMDKSGKNVRFKLKIDL